MGQMNEWDPIVPNCRSSSAGQIHVLWNQGKGCTAKGEEDGLGS